MDPVSSRLLRRDDRPRDPYPAGWACSAILGLAIFAIPWPATSRAGEPSGPTPPDGSDAPKARVATAPHETKGPQRVLDASPAAGPSIAANRAELDSFARALKVIADCKAKYQTIDDYTCTFFKRERVDGKLYTPHIMSMKARTKTTSLYFKFIQPNAGREAIYVKGHYNNKIVAHDVGIGRVIAGTMHLDPKGGMAMEENRHPVSEAGIGSLIDTVEKHWKLELRPGEAQVVFHPNMQVGDRPCLMVESTHPKEDARYMFHKVKFYVDRELGLPIRFEAYDWPEHPGAAADLVEEYSYMNLRTNVGLKDRDFDPKNSQYAYGRF